ncbi:hypothetical protein Rsub_00159 [Raphidocelis subcapitata]|uniref:Uncharacterized protein n=1 Tax=Raphidocelis subcapitata TaxID=307507 RepID=A0A2V0NJN7_9CHLO|nr:hypothetical protein Rsub_00159 [Raphidocelis subcapitata]|eukprot:GBF87448.1 hypothetical protein Rsub_00159 [Raphidocelis subcapitata]
MSPLSGGPSIVAGRGCRSPPPAELAAYVLGQGFSCGAAQARPAPCGASASGGPVETGLPRADEAGLDETLLSVLAPVFEAVRADPGDISTLALLARAVRAASTDPDKGRAMAIEVLALVQMASRLRASLAEGRPHSADGCTACSPPARGAPSGDDATSSDASGTSCRTPPPAEPGRKRAASCSCSDSGSGATSASADDGDSAAAKRQRLAEEMPPPAPRRPGAGPPGAAAPAKTAAEAAVGRMLHDGNASARPAPGALLGGEAVGLAHWHGRLLHRRGGSVAELASLAIQMPAPFLDQMPSVLYAAELAHRRSVPLGLHAVCRCALPAGSNGRRQLAALGAMAGAALVAVVPLQLCDLIVVPYLDAGKQVRVVAFMRVLDDAAAPDDA